MPSLSPDALAAIRVDWAADEAERDVLRAFRGTRPADFVDAWPDMATLVADAFLASQVDALAITAENLTELVGSEVTPDPLPWLGRVGKSSLPDFLDITPMGFMARIAGGMTLLESLVTTASFISSSAAAETHAVARGATCYTASDDQRFQGWVRVTEPGACDFCRMLASRGAVYKSRDSASKRANGLRYHTKRANGSGGLCRCTVKALPQGEGATQWDGKGAPPSKRPMGKRPKKLAAPAAPSVYKPGANTPERAKFIRHQVEVLSAMTAAGKGAEWDRNKLAELTAELATF